MSHILLLPFGTSGSVFPFIWLGRKLMERGHRVSIIASPLYEQVSLRAGLAFFPPDPDELPEMLADPDLWKLRNCKQVAFTYAGLAVAPCMTAIERVILEAGKPDLMLAPMITFAARIAREKHRIGLLTVHLYPAAMMSAHDTPLVLPGIRLLRLLPLTARKFILSLPSPFDRYALPAVRRCCAEHGVTPPHRLWKLWHHSPDGVLALFPSWFCGISGDQPRNTFQWDFPLEDMVEQRTMEPDLTRFLAAGTKPILFTAGTGQFHAAEFFEIASRVVSQLGCRAVFLTVKKDQLPPNLPDSIFVTAYVPFSRILPLAALMVHHGGIGTLSQCLAAGTPQLVVFMSLDQPDNAARIERLGVGLSINRQHLTARRLLPLVKRCLEDRNIQSNASIHADRMRQRAPTEAMLGWIEDSIFTGLHGSKVGQRPMVDGGFNS
jgi:rhamnosyltransferase subunit B